MIDHPRRVTRALLSVSDKSGLIEFARALSSHAVELVSTGGTAKALAAAGLKVRDVSELTGFPEMMDGRVKTLHPKVHGGLLAIRDDAEHVAAMKSHGIAPIDLLVVNLYPFEATVDQGADFETCIENIDIGGPAMSSRTTRAPRHFPCAGGWRPRRTHAPPPTTQRFRTGLRASSRPMPRIFVALAAA